MPSSRPQPDPSFPSITARFPAAGSTATAPSSMISTTSPSPWVRAPRRTSAAGGGRVRTPAVRKSGRAPERGGAAVARRHAVRAADRSSACQHGGLVVMSRAAGSLARVLVAVASRMGSTAEIGEAVAARLRAGAHEATVVPVGEAPGPEAFDAVVVGSAVYISAGGERLPCATSGSTRRLTARAQRTCSKVVPPVSGRRASTRPAPRFPGWPSRSAGALRWCSGATSTLSEPSAGSPSG
jgi:hypothetical protein